MCCQLNLQLTTYQVDIRSRIMNENNPKGYGRLFWYSKRGGAKERARTRNDIVYMAIPSARPSAVTIALAWAVVKNNMPLARIRPHKARIVNWLLFAGTLDWTGNARTRMYNMEKPKRAPGMYTNNADESPSSSVAEPID